MLTSEQGLSFKLFRAWALFSGWSVFPRLRFVAGPTPRFMRVLVALTVSRAITGSIIAARWVQQERDRLGNAHPAFVDVLAYADAHHPGWRDA